MKNQSLAETASAPPIDEANAWLNQVILYLAQSGLDASYEVRFRQPQAFGSYSHGAPPQHEKLWNALNVRTGVLNKFIEELKD